MTEPHEQVQSAQVQPRISPPLLFVLACMWIVVSLAGGRLAALLTIPGIYDAVRMATTAAMLFAGFYLMARLGIPDLRPLSSVGLVRRPGAGREFGVGSALGWGVGLLLVLPAVLSGRVSTRIHLDWVNVRESLLSLAVLLLFAAVVQLVLAGLPVRLLVRSIGPGRTVTAVLLVGVILALSAGNGDGRGVLYTLLALCLSVTAFLRTRAAWLPLGLQVGLSCSVQLLFGAHSPYTPLTGGVVETQSAGPVWLTGGAYGPEASSVAVVVLLACLPVLMRVTREYAWHYTYQPAVAGGYPVEVPPPAAHGKESQPAAAAPLVQIGGLGQAPPDGSFPAGREPGYPESAQ